MFQRFAKKGRKAGPGEPQLTVAAFGKHPGWDDHIPGLGVETEALAELMQSLYVSGIGRQIDSGAWEKLDPEKRLEGFDHTFLWLRGSDAILGELWSSQDGKGRSKYPMVLCVHGEEVAPEVLVGHPHTVLKNARDGCRASQSAHHVGIECRAAQDQLRSWLKNGPAANASAAESAALRRQFLDRLTLGTDGADSLGLSRVLHELDNATGRAPGRTSEASGAADLRPYHVRVPLGADSLDGGLILWTALLRCVLPASVPLLLIVRHDTSWLDIILGSPSGDDLFCLQASVKALPLATDVPYELAADMPQRFAAWRAKFLGTTVPNSTQTEPTPVAPLAKTGGKAGTASGGKLGGAALLMGLLALLAGGVYFRPKIKPPSSGQPPARVTVNPPDRAEQKDQSASKAAQAKELEQSYQAALQEVLAALGRQDAAAALVQADKALAIRPNDPAVTKLRADAQAQLALAAQAKDQEQKYRSALQEVQAALSRQDYAGALAQADAALALRPKDPAATKLKADAQAQLTLAAQTREQEQKYQSALQELQAAMSRQDYAGALAQADAALALRPKDPALTKLKADAQAQLTLAAQARDLEQKYQSALQEVQAATSRQDYAAALAQADAALALRPKDPALTKLKSDAQAQLTLATQTKELEQKYQSALQELQAAMSRKDYATAIAQAEAALRLRPNDPAATQLKSDAQAGLTLASQAREKEEKYQAALQQVQAAISRKQYQAAVAQADAALVLRSKDPAVTKLKSDAQAQLALAAQAKDQDQKYQMALQQVQGAISRQEYAAAVTQAEAALVLRPNDPAVTKLKSDAQAQLALAAQAKDQSRLQKAAVPSTNQPAHAPEQLAQTPRDDHTEQRSTLVDQRTTPRTNGQPQALPPPSPADALLSGLEARFLRNEDPAVIVKDKQVAQRIKNYTADEAAKKLKLLETNYRETGRLKEDIEQRIKVLREAIKNSKPQ